MLPPSHYQNTYLQQLSSKPVQQKSRMMVTGKHGVSSTPSHVIRNAMQVHHA